MGGAGGGRKNHVVSKFQPKKGVKPWFPYNSKSCDPILKNLTYLKNLDKNTLEKNSPPPPMGGAGEGVKNGKIPSFRAASTSVPAV